MRMKNYFQPSMHVIFLTSYSTDGNIEPKDLLMNNLNVEVTLLTQDVPRYRVSKQRQSERARA